MAWDWKKTAGEARERLATAKHGKREAALKGTRDSTDVNTVRRAIAALDFLDRLKSTDPESYKVLKDSSFGVAEIFSRWWSINAADAVVGLSKWKKGELTTRGLAALMRKSPTPTAAKTNESLIPTYGKNLEPRLRRDIETMLGTDVKRSEEKRPAHRPPVDFRYSFKDSFYGRDGEVAAIVVGPYQNQTIYRKKRHDWMLKALGLAHFFDWVFVVIPAASALDDYKTWLERARADLGAEPVGHGTSADPLNRLRILLIQ